MSVMKAKNILVICAMAFLSSCSTIRMTSDSTPVMTPVSTYPTVADLNIQPTRISKTVTWQWNPFSTMSLSTRKDNVTAELVNENGADILIEPEYVQKTSWLNILGGSITVSGYPATFENFRKATPEDIEALKAVAPVKECKEKKGKKRFLIF